ncbi:MAG TPA: polysaccharide deacetylase family protein [Candidatus Limnocylindrales bacterium]|nr:polysaccharide deacetylase family protein [Candidatus Limnocylindrales bacterium]
MTAADSPFRVALTFDAEHPDRPARLGNDARLLNALQHADVRATVFIQGRWAEAHPEVARRVATDGHLVGHHSHYHVRMIGLSAHGLQSDIARGEEAILEATGVDPHPWFRCPFGSGDNDPRVQRAIRWAGYRHVGWNVAGIDWESDRTARDVENTVVDASVAHGDGAVVLLHSWPDQSVGAVAGIVRRLRARGATFVTVDELPVRSVPRRDVSVGIEA